MFRPGFDEDRLRRQFSGAHVKFRTGEITFRTGKTISPPPGTSQDRFVIAIANFEHGIGLLIDFPPSKYRAYFSPMSRTNLREFTVSPNGKYDDKSYLDLDYAQQKIRNPIYYMALLDAGIKGDFSLASTLPAAQQEILIDTLGIAIAECYQKHQLTANLRRWRNTPPRRARNHDMERAYVRAGISFLNAFLGQLYNLGGLMVIEGGSGRHIQKGGIGQLYHGSDYQPQIRGLNELLITRAIAVAHPYHYTLLVSSVGNAYRDNFFDLLGFLVRHPEYYDDNARLALWHIISHWDQDVLLVNRTLLDYPANMIDPAVILAAVPIGARFTSGYRSRSR